MEGSFAFYPFSKLRKQHHSQRENSFSTIGGRKMISQPVKIGDDTVVVIPSVILSELGIREGDTLEIALNKDKMEIKKMVLKTSSPTDSSEEG
ncbi:AbrB/MazE/SpoVT family DNA-binding domain-containing protein [Vibrio owensii]